MTLDVYCVRVMGEFTSESLPILFSLAQSHRRRIYTETKAKSRCFCLGDKIICRTGNLTVMCGIVYTAVVLFPLLLLEGGGGGMFSVDLYFKLNTHTHRFNYFIYKLFARMLQNI